MERCVDESGRTGVVSVGGCWSIDSDRFGVGHTSPKKKRTTRLTEVLQAALVRALQQVHDAPAVEVVELLPLALDEAPDLGDALRQLPERALQLAPDGLERVRPVLPEQLPLEEPVCELGVGHVPRDAVHRHGRWDA